MTTLAGRAARAGCIALLVLAAVVAGLDGAGAANPQCQALGPPKRVAVAAARNGGPLSPLQIAADPTVIRDGAIYRMWFTNANGRGQTGIATAQSTDGIMWDVYRDPVSPDPVMDLVLTAPADGWDAPGIETADVLRAPDGTYMMYYSGNRVPQGSITYAIGLATSLDGLHWTRRDRPVLEAENTWEQPVCTVPGVASSCRTGGVLEPSILYDPAARQYKLWYVGLGELANSFRTYRIGYAVSDDGIVWRRRPNPVFDLGSPGAWDEMWTTHVKVIADPSAGYHMFYFGSAPRDYRDGVEMQRGSIGHAYSTDGVTWKRDQGPILSPRAGQVDAWSLGGPTALIQGYEIKLWYFASPTSGLRSSIVLTTVPCGP